jgi:hypothetical protein
MARIPILKHGQLADIVRLLEHEPLESTAKLLGVSKTTLVKYLRKHREPNDDWTPSQHAGLLNALLSSTVDKVLESYRWTMEELETRLRMLRQHLTVAGLTLSQVAQLTHIDRSYWRRYIADGWVCAEQSPGRNRIPITEIGRLANEHPELFPYKDLSLPVQELFALQAVERPLRYKLVVCRSTSIESKVVDVEADQGRPAVALEILSCADLGGVRFWAEIYSIPTCPRCGVRTSRLSEDGVYSDAAGDVDEVKNAMASKIGLRWRAGGFETPAGVVLSEEDVSAHVRQVTKGNNRERDRKFQLIEDIKRYKAGGDS